MIRWDLDAEWDAACVVMSSFGRKTRFARGLSDENVDADLIRHNPPWTKQNHPYDYDPFTIWGHAGPSKECNGTVYTDRLHQWDHEKYDRLAKKHYQRDGIYHRPFDSHRCKGELIQEFLRDWMDAPQLKLLRVVEYCSPATGYQTWSLSYVTKKET